MLRSELSKAFTGKPLFILLTLGLCLTLLFAYGFAETLFDPKHPPYTPEVASGMVLRSFFAMTVFAAMMGTMIITREFGTGAIARTTMAAHNRSQVFVLKSLSALVVGALMGGVAVLAGIPISMVLVYSKGIEFAWTRDVITIAIGVFAATVLSALWGLFIGFITRNSVVAICVIALVTWMIEPAIQNIAPAISGYMFTLATTGVVLDPHEELLGVGWSYTVLISWNIVLGAIAHAIFTRKDIA